MKHFYDLFKATRTGLLARPKQKLCNDTEMTSEFMIIFVLQNPPTVIRKWQITDTRPDLFGFCLVSF